MNARRSAFTMIELLVVIGIIGLLMALVIPAVHHAQEASRRVRCSSNLAQIGKALTGYHGVHQTLPPAKINPGAYRPVPGNPRSPVLGGGTKNTTGWVLLLPHLDEQELYHQYNMDQCSSANATNSLPWMPVAGTDAANSTVVGASVGVFVCPSDSKTLTITYNPGTPSDPKSIHNGRQSSYLFSTSQFDESGPLYRFLERHPAQGMFGTNDSASDHLITDGASQSIAVGESLRGGPVTPEGPFWGAGVDGCCYGTVTPGGASRFSSRHSGGSNYLFGDGSVRLLGDDIDAALFFALQTIHGDESVNGAF